MTENLDIKWCKRNLSIYNENELITCINTSGLTLNEINNVLRKDKKMTEFLSTSEVDETDQKGFTLKSSGCKRNCIKWGNCSFSFFGIQIGCTCTEYEYRC